MLVLSRKKGESVVVNGNITIVVVDVRGDKARIGIEAPADVAVYRSEVLAKKATANESGEAANGADGTSKRGKAGRGRGARKKPVAPSDGNVEIAVETLYLSNDAEAYRRSDASEEETAKTDERVEPSVSSESVAPGNDVK